MKMIPEITKRFSPTTFTEQTLTEEQLTILFTAAGRAASSFNEQPWRFIYALKQDKKAFNNILNCLVEGNQEWAKNAAALIITVSKKNFTKNEKPNPHNRHDLGLAVGNLCAQATAMGLHLHQMGGFSAEKAINNLNIPEGFEPVTAIAIGYYDGEFVEIPRKAVEEIMFKNEWK
ncbi:MAG: nitroreductase family protein [Flavobacteriales bacterium]|nr:nitroreductase family protein [Flavobacteriales bacterium]